jgi:exodeoxyribonuclease VII large subunit
MVAPDYRDLHQNIKHLAIRLKTAVRTSLSRKAGVVEELLKRLYDPRRQIQEKSIALDDLSGRMIRAMQRTMEDLRAQTDSLSGRLRPARLTRQIRDRKDDCATLFSRLIRTIGISLKDRRNSVENLAARLDGLSPLAVMARGYSITEWSETRSVITDSRAVEIGEPVLVRLHRGELHCRVTNKISPED